MPNTERIGARIEATLKKALAEEAKRQDRSESYIISLALSEYLRRTKE